MLKGALLKLALLLLAVLGISYPAFAQEDDIERIKQAGVLRVGLAESVPFQFRDPKSNEWLGFNVDQAKNLAEVLGVKLEIVDATWATLIPGLMTNKFDICMVDMFATPQRAVTVLFTDPYVLIGYQMFVPANSSAQSWEDLNEKGKVFAQVSGTYDEQLARQTFPKAEVRALITDNNNTMFMEVANGNADAALMTELGIRMFMAQNPNTKIKVVEPERSMSPVGNAYAIRPGNYHFINMLNTWIAFNKDNGGTEELRQKWMVKYFEEAKKAVQ